MRALILRLMSHRMRQRLRHLRDYLNFFLKRQVARSSLLAWFSYASSPHFFADFRAFFAGAALYGSRQSSPAPNIALLRRNIHRIEKGICHPERRIFFARDYILETVLTFDKLQSHPTLRMRSEMTWAQDVLTQYFDLTKGDDDEYLRAQTIFEALPQNDDDRDLMVPAQYVNTCRDDDHSRFMALVRQRKSLRKFTNKEVPVSAIRNALEAASLAPSSCNRQPYKYYILRDPAKAREAAAISAGTTGWLDEIHCLAVVVGDTSCFLNAANRHSIYVDSALSIMPFVLSLEAQGLSSCLINWADDHRRRKKIEPQLNLKPHQRVIVSIAIGWADTTNLVPASVRKRPEEIHK